MIIATVQANAFLQQRRGQNVSRVIYIYVT